MPRVPLALALILALAAPAAAAEEVGGSALDLRLRAMWAANPSEPDLTAYIEISPPLRDPRVAAAWSALPSLALLVVGGGATLANNASVSAATADQTARGIAPADQYVASHPLLAPLGGLYVLTPIAFGGGQFYAGEPWRGTLVTLGGPLATFAGFLAGALVLPALFPYQAPPPPAVPMGSGYALTMGLFSGIAACAGYGGWAIWDAYQVAQSKNRIPVRLQPGPILKQ